MLFGHFLKQINDDSPISAIPEELKPGSIVVAVADMQQLRDTGLPCSLRFGITTETGEIICQSCECEMSEIPEVPRFTIKKQDIKTFTEEGRKLYIYPYIFPNIEIREPGMVLMAAKMHVGITYHELRSYPGDDFVAECLSGLPLEKMIEKATKAGQHWWTPLQMTLRQGLKWLGVDVPDGWLPQAADVQVFDQTHHGIAIEGDQVIHFSTRRVPGGANRIKTDSLKEFRSIGDDDRSGSPVKYKEETPEQRLRCRNRAVWVFCHADSWGSYNLMDNNCEHFSRYCRVGRKESRQVLSASMEALGSLISVLPRSVPFRPLIMALGILMRNIARVLGRPESAKECSDSSPLILE